MHRRIDLGLLLTLAIAGPLEGQSPEPIALDVVARLGRASDTDILFERIEAVEVDAEGRIYVLDGLAHTLTAFEPGHGPAWTVGREGKGPGEFLSPVGLAWAPDGNLWVVDPENQRVTSVTCEGRVAETRTLPAGFSLSPWPGRFDRSGRFHSYLESTSGPYAYEMAVYDEGLRRTGTRPLPEPPEAVRFFEGTTARGSDVRARVPFTPSLVWRLDGDGRFVSAWTAALRFHGPFGELSAGAVRAGRGPAVTRGERDDALDRLARFVEMGGRVDASRIPDRKPVLQTFVLDDEDRIWVFLSRAGGDEAASIAILDPADGSTLTARVTARIASVPTPVVRLGWLVGVERDALGLETVVLVDLRARPELSGGGSRAGSACG